jgi:hypothetical protein
MERLSTGFPMAVLILVALVSLSGCIDYESVIREAIIHEAVEDLTAWGEAPSPLLQEILDLLDKLSVEEHGYVGVGCYKDGTCSQGTCNPNGMCIPCGNVGEPVCTRPGEPACFAPSVQQGPICVSRSGDCGHWGEPPCEGGYCILGNLNRARNICMACGGEMQVPCEDTAYPCDPGLVVKGGACRLPSP